MAILDNGIKMMFFNICWHRLYEGPLSDDKTDSRHGYFIHEGHEWGEECYTFLPINEKLYFHGPVKEEKTIRLENLDPQNSDEFVDDILTVFISTDPVSSQQYIVGWYKHARVFREFQEFHDTIRRNQNGGTWHYNVITSAEYGFRVDYKDRHKFPFSKKFRRTWYANELKYKNFCKDVYNYIIKCEFERENDNKSVLKIRRSSKEDTNLNTNATRKAGNYNQNVAERQLIENIAIEMTEKFYDDKLYAVKNVDKFARGWDLEVSKGDEYLKVEVKGTKSGNIFFELTPNEYKKLGEFTSQYRIAVVTECLSAEPKLTIFNIRKKNNIFEGYSGDIILNLTERPGAIGSVEIK